MGVAIICAADTLHWKYIAIDSLIMTFVFVFFGCFFANEWC